MIKVSKDIMNETSRVRPQEGICTYTITVKGYTLDSNEFADGEGPIFSIPVSVAVSFTGESKCRYPDKFDAQTGTAIAKLRAVKKYLNWLILKEKEEMIPIQNTYKAMECYKNFNPRSTEAYAVRRQLNGHVKVINGYKSAMSIIEEQLKHFCN